MGQLEFIFIATSNGCNNSYRRFIANANHVDLVGCEEKHLARRYFKIPVYSLAISSSSCTFDSESNRDSRVCVTYLLSTCFSEVAKVFGPIFGATIPFIFSQPPTFLAAKLRSPLCFSYIKKTLKCQISK